MTARRRLPHFVALAITVGLAATVHIASATRDFGWKATRGSAAIYLIGSLHLLSPDFYPLSPTLDSAFKEADLLVEEVDLGEMLAPESQMRMLTRGLLPAGQTLDQVLTPATYTLVAKRLEASGLPVEPLKRFKPWMLAVTLLGLEWQKAGFDPSLGLDQHFYDRAKSEGKAIQGLETVEYQIARFDGMPADVQDRLLAETLKELDTERTHLQELANAWKAGDAATIERIVLEDVKSEPQIYDRLLVERNRNWLPKIEALFSRPGRALVVVGAAHLVGPDGLLQMLKAKGYTIDQL